MTASWWHLRRAVQTLRSGGLIAHATEGVWGLACDPDNLAAVARILHLKDRAMSKGLLLLGAHPDTFAAELAELSAADRATALAAWPGPSTFVLPNSRRPHWPHWITGDHSGVALRVPGHAQARALCNGFGGPLVSTSANPAGRRAADTELKVRAYFGQKVDFYLPGQVINPGRSSRIVDLASGRTLRSGSAEGAVLTTAVPGNKSMGT